MIVKEVVEIKRVLKMGEIALTEETGVLRGE